MSHPPNDKSSLNVNEHRADELRFKAKKARFEAAKLRKLQQEALASAARLASAVHIIVQRASQEGNSSCSNSIYVNRPGFH